MLIFAYGTLKRGHGNHGLLRGVSDFVGAALTVKPYPMFNFGVPGVFDVEDPRAKNIFGEVFNIRDDRDIYRIDCLEGHPHSYTRKIIKVAKFDGTILDVWCYFLYESAYRQVIENRSEPNYLDYFL